MAGRLIFNLHSFVMKWIVSSLVNDRLDAKWIYFSDNSGYSYGTVGTITSRTKWVFKLGFDRYGHTDTNMVIPISYRYIGYFTDTDTDMISCSPILIPIIDIGYIVLAYYRSKHIASATIKVAIKRKYNINSHRAYTKH